MNMNFYVNGVRCWPVRGMSYYAILQLDPLDNSYAAYCELQDACDRYCNAIEKVNTPDWPGHDQLVMWKGVVLHEEKVISRLCKNFNRPEKNDPLVVYEPTPENLRRLVVFSSKDRDGAGNFTQSLLRGVSNNGGVRLDVCTYMEAKK